MSSRQRIADSSVSGEIIDENIPSVAGRRRNDSARERAIEVRDHSKAETARKINISTKRELVSAVQKRGTEVSARLVVVGGCQDEILVAISRRAGHLRTTSGVQAGKAVRNLEIGVLDSLDRIADVLDQFHLQSVIYRASNWLEHKERRLSWVFATESAGCRHRGRAARTEISAAAQSVSSEISYSRGPWFIRTRSTSGIARAVHNRFIDRRNAAVCQRSGNGRLCACETEIRHVSVVVNVYTQQ